MLVTADQRKIQLYFCSQNLQKNILLLSMVSHLFYSYSLLCFIFQCLCVGNFKDKVFSNNPAFWQKFVKNVRERNFSKLILQNFATVANQEEFKWAPEVERGCWRVFNVENAKETSHQL